MNDPAPLVIQSSERVLDVPVNRGQLSDDGAFLGADSSTSYYSERVVTVANAVYWDAQIAPASWLIRAGELVEARSADGPNGVVHRRGGGENGRWTSTTTVPPATATYLVGATERALVYSTPDVGLIAQPDGQPIFSVPYRPGSQLLVHDGPVAVYVDRNGRLQWKSRVGEGLLLDVAPTEVDFVVDRKQTLHVLAVISGALVYVQARTDGGLATVEVDVGATAVDETCNEGTSTAETVTVSTPRLVLVGQSPQLLFERVHASREKRCSRVPVACDPSPDHDPCDRNFQCRCDFGTQEIERELVWAQLAPGDDGQVSLHEKTLAKSADLNPTLLDAATDGNVVWVALRAGGGVDRLLLAAEPDVTKPQPGRLRSAAYLPRGHSRFESLMYGWTEVGALDWEDGRIELRGYGLLLHRRLTAASGLSLTLRGTTTSETAACGPIGIAARGDDHSVSLLRPQGRAVVLVDGQSVLETPVEPSELVEARFFDGTLQLVIDNEERARAAYQVPLPASSVVELGSLRLACRTAPSTGVVEEGAALPVTAPWTKVTSKCGGEGQPLCPEPPSPDSREANSAPD